MHIESIPLSKLVPSAANVRKTAGQSIDQLAASIATHGLIHNLTVVPQERDGKPTGKYAVVAGGRRYQALKALAKLKVVPGNHPVPCLVKTEAEATELSLAENIIREAMHPADEIDTFRRLVEAGNSIEDIAARFSVDALQVRRRLRLAHVSPALIDLYRKGQITTDHMKAFALSDSHAEQEAAWFAAPEHRRSVTSLRAALTERDVNPATDRRARFIGREAYLAAGGTVRQDLFADEATASWTDAPLLERLALEKLEAEAAAIRGEGWAWVQAVPTYSYSLFSDLERRYPERVELSEGEASTLDALTAQLAELEERDDADPAAVSDLEERIRQIEERSEQWPAEVLAIGGAVVSIDYEGGLRIDRGLIRPEDRKAQAAGDSSGTNTGEAPAPRKMISDRLMETLTAHRTMALRAVLMDRPDIALVSVVHALMIDVFYGASSYNRPTALELSIDQRGRLAPLAGEGIDGSPAQVALNQRHGQWVLRIPACHSEAWEWLVEQDQETVLQLLAYCSAQMVNAVRHAHSNAFDGRLVASNNMAATLGLDMADWWQATKESYFAAVPKAAILDAVSEAVSPEAAGRLAGFKKADLAAEAELQLAGTRWLPAPLRRHDDDEAEAEALDAADEAPAEGEQADNVDPYNLAA